MPEKKYPTDSLFDAYEGPHMVWPWHVFWPRERQEQQVMVENLRREALHRPNASYKRSAIRDDLPPELQQDKFLNDISFDGFVKLTPKGGGPMEYGVILSHLGQSVCMLWLIREQKFEVLTTDGAATFRLL